MFAKICEFLPFESCVTIIREIMNNNLGAISTRNIVVFSLYTIITFVISVVVFKNRLGDAH